jgi:hypothetical protein
MLVYFFYFVEIDNDASSTDESSSARTLTLIAPSEATSILTSTATAPSGAPNTSSPMCEAADPESSAATDNLKYDWAEDTAARRVTEQGKMEPTGKATTSAPLADPETSIDFFRHGSVGELTGALSRSPYNSSLTHFLK